MGEYNFGNFVSVIAELLATFHDIIGEIIHF
jgi:hypothetical protein